MTKRAVVHIGTTKTGTKTIQRALFSARSKLLSDAGILYPSIAANQSTYLVTVFRDEAPRRVQLIDPDATDEKSVARLRRKYRASLDADIANTDWHTLVISAESLSGFDAKAIARLIEWLHSSHAFRGVRTSDDTTYVEYDSGERELYRLDADPFQLENAYRSTDSATIASLEDRLRALEGCARARCRTAEGF